MNREKKEETPEKFKGRWVRRDVEGCDGTCKHCKDCFESLPKYWVERYLWLKYSEGDNPFLLVTDGAFRKDIITVSIDRKTYRRDKSNGEWKEDED